MVLQLRPYFSIISWIRVKLKYLIPALIVFIVTDHFGVFVHLFEVDYGKFSYPLDIPMKDVLAAMKTGAEPPYKPINKYDYFYTIKNEQKCVKPNSNEHEKVVILYAIKSALNHQDRRDIIRKTWGWENRFSDVLIRRIFIVGISSDNSIQEAIAEEHVRNKDMVQADFIDSYYNNTIKTTLALQWVIQNCPKAQFIVFSDDDMYISTKNMLKFIRNPFNRRVGFRRRRHAEDTLHSLWPNMKTEKRDVNTNRTSPLRNLKYDSNLSAFDGRLFAGFLFNSPPMRHKSSKWYVTLKEYPFSKYPPYVTAGAFVLSYPALEDIYYTSLFTKPFKFDDVYLGIVAHKCNIVPLHNENFYFWKKSYGVEAYSNVIASHGYEDSAELQKVWEEQRSSGHA